MRLRVGFLLLWFPVLLAAQTNNNAVQKIDDLLISFKANRGDVFFPEIYLKIKNSVRKLKADPTFSGEENSAIDLPTLINDLMQKIQDSRTAQQTFAFVLDVRDDALNVGATTFAPDILVRADKKLQKAAALLVRKNSKSALAVGEEARRLYLEAESETIRKSLLGQVGILIQESEDLGARDYAPQTYRLATQLQAQLEKMIDQKDFNNPELGQKAKQASNTAKKLLWIIQTIDQSHREKKQWERFLLNLEEKLSKIGKQLGSGADFSDGIDGVLDDYLTLSKNKKQEEERLRKRVVELEHRQNELERKLARLQDANENKKMLQAKIASVKKLLASEGFSVQEDDRFLKINVPTIPFRVGRAEFRPSFLKAMDKIALAVSYFPERKIYIHLQQFGQGNAEYNNNLTQKRATAFKLYLQSKFFIKDELITATGNFVPAGKTGSAPLIRGEVRIDLSGE